MRRIALLSIVVSFLFALAACKGKKEGETAKKEEKKEQKASKEDQEIAEIVDKMIAAIPAKELEKTKQQTGVDIHAKLKQALVEGFKKLEKAKRQKVIDCVKNAKDEKAIDKCMSMEEAKPLAQHVQEAMASVMQQAAQAAAQKAMEEAKKAQEKAKKEAEKKK